MPNYAALKTKLADAQFAALVQKGDCDSLAAAFNALTGPNSGPVTMSQCSPAYFYGCIATASIQIAGLTDTKAQARWGQHVPAYLPLLGGAPINLAAGSSAQSLIAQAVTDGLLTAQQAAAIPTRTGSLAETIGFFDNPITDVPQQLTHGDIGQALNMK